MAGKLGVVRVYVDGLDEAGEGDQQNAHQRQGCEVPVFARIVCRRNQEKHPNSNSGYAMIYSYDAPRSGLSCQPGNVTNRKVPAGAWFGPG